MIILETERLVLREMTLADLPETRKIVCDEQTMYAWEGAWSERENQEALEKQMRAYRQDGFGRWAVVLKTAGEFTGLKAAGEFTGLKAAGEFVGMCGLQWSETDEGRVLEIGYLFNRAHWRNGYATEAAIACKRYAFDILKAGEVFSLIRDTNIASMNVAIRNGMLVRRRFNKHYRGVDMPHYVFSARKDDETRIDEETGKYEETRK